MPLKNTIWPEGQFPIAIKIWLETLFTLLDSKEPDVPQRVATLYTENAVVYGIAGKATGTARQQIQYFLLFTYSNCLLEIIQAREKSWATMESRKHELLRVYTSNSDFSDLLLIGKLSANFKNGKEATDEFIVRLVLEGETTHNPKGSLYQVWGVGLLSPLFFSTDVRPGQCSLAPGYETRMNNINPFCLDRAS